MERSSEKRAQIIVSGRVQGVFFRSFAESSANALGLTGWVKNLSDGASVEVVVEGPEERIKTLLTKLRKGPPAARVDKVEVKWEKSRKEFSSFETEE